MMIEFWISGFACIAFGVLATLHPCPFSVMVSSVTLLSGMPGSRNKRRFYLLIFGLAYMFVIAGVGIALGLGVFSISKMSLYLQRVFPAFLGPLFIISGMILNGLLDFGKYKNGLLLKIPSSSGSLTSVLYVGGMVGLSFCPATAALYFGAMMPLAIQQDHLVLFPTLYGFGAVLPIVVISGALQQFQHKFKSKSWLKSIPIIAGWILILAGVYISVDSVF